MAVQHASECLPDIIALEQEPVCRQNIPSVHQHDIPYQQIRRADLLCLPIAHNRHLHDTTY